MDSSITVNIKKGELFLEKVPQNLKNIIIAAKIGDKLYDLSDEAPEDSTALLIDINSAAGEKILLHSAAHLLANAIVDLYPGALPNTSNESDETFYYDFNMDPVSTTNFPKIEEKMKEIADKNIVIQKKTLDRAEILKIFAGNKYKIDKIKENVPDGSKSTIYIQGNYTEFCRGPHIPSTKYLKAFKILSISSTNYEGDITKEKMIRIYGTAFPDKKQLNAFLLRREEAAKRDHRKIGQEMDLFIFDNERAPGMPFYAPNGAIIRNELINYMKELNSSSGWEEVWTAHAFRDIIWKQSGHYYKYKDDMFLFTLKNGDSYGLKPMNCPGHIAIFQRNVYSYRDMPVKYSEAGTVYRYEKSGEMGGLTRPRGFTIDDGHGFVREDQIFDETTSLLKIIPQVFTTIFGKTEITYDLSAMDKEHPENYLMAYECGSCGEKFMFRAASGELKCPKCDSTDLKTDFSMWDNATGNLRKALDSLNLKYIEYPGEAAFYGPKIDVHIKDALGRSWQLSTIQLDFFMPANFDLYYIDSENRKARPVIIHRAIYGSYERFIAILLEHFNGKLPTWLTPIQAYVIPVSDAYTDYAKEINKSFIANGIRTKIDSSDGTISKKIKLIHAMRPSYIIVVGEKEYSTGTIAVRNRSDKTRVFAIDEFLKLVHNEINNKNYDQFF
ncbi:MAG: threonine--tRNA ligase [Ferroplasma sp.]